MWWLRELHHEGVKRHKVDTMRKEQGEMLVEYMKNSGFCFVNG